MTQTIDGLLERIAQRSNSASPRPRRWSTLHTSSRIAPQATSTSFAEVSPLQRMWRDSEVASRHAVVAPEISALIYGRALMGFTDGVSPLV